MAKTAAPPMTQVLYTPVMAMTPIFSPIGGVGGGAQQPGQDVGQTVGDQRAMETRIPDQVTAHDVAGDEQVAQVFGQHHEQRRAGSS